MTGTLPGVTAPVAHARGLSGFGMELLLDMAGCSPAIITSGEALKTWAATLADRIGMTVWGPPTAAHFGEGELRGWTVVQLITTSSISVHAVEASNDAHVNVFSCRAFDPDAATAYTVGYFAAATHRARVVPRYAPTRRS